MGIRLSCQDGAVVLLKLHCTFDLPPAVALIAVRVDADDNRIGLIDNPTSDIDQ